MNRLSALRAQAEQLLSDLPDTPATQGLADILQGRFRAEEALLALASDWKQKGEVWQECGVAAEHLILK